MTVEVVSKNGVSIRLPDERWDHIIDEHGELADLRQQVLDTLSEPERILRGAMGELLAVKEIETGKWLIVIYRETDAVGFVITAFLTRQISYLRKRKQIWP